MCYHTIPADCQVIACGVKCFWFEWENSAPLRHLATLTSLAPSLTLFPCIWLCWHSWQRKEGRVGHDKRVVILVSWCPLCVGVPLMRQVCWSESVEGGLGNIKTHCGVSRVGHSPAVETPKAWRGNKGPPMSLHGKDSDITAITSPTAWTFLGKATSE